MVIAQRLSSLRQELETHQLDGFIVPHSDEFQSEYLPACAERLAWITGFTGSAGCAAILKDKAVAMTHGIYEIQIRKQVDQSLFDIGDLTKTTLGDWITDNTHPDAVIGYDPRLHTRVQIDQITEKTAQKNITLKPLALNPLDKVWEDRPPPPVGIVELFPDIIAGKTSKEKRKNIADSLQLEKIKSVIITMADSICWLLNVRGNDIPFNPLVLSTVILHDDGTVDWYVDSAKIPDSVRTALGTEIRIYPSENYESDLKKLSGTVQVDPQRSSMVAETILKQQGIKTIDGKDPCVTPKSIKTRQEQQAIKQSHIRDGVAVSKFLHWLDCQDLEKNPQTEISLSDKLEEFRKGHASYREPSFATISGWADNGAIIHYHATPETNKRITGNNLYLLDSGGQYEYGTTDITRTIVIGKISDMAKNHFTRVLKGHIAVAMAQFDDTMDGAALDKLARAPLRDVGLDYAHGTGHGVGCMLAVHEEAPYISPRGTGLSYKAGMVLSNEPGFYLENHYGIRHENLILCQEQDDGSLYWETITLVPFDLRGVDWSLITPAEKDWILSYHTRVFDALSPHLLSEEVDWLRHVCFSYLK